MGCLFKYFVDKLIGNPNPNYTFSVLNFFLSLEATRKHKGYGFISDNLYFISLCHTIDGIYLFSVTTK